MIRKLSLFFVLSCLSGTLYSQSPISLLWSKDFKNTLNSINQAADLKIDSHGNAYALVQSWTPDSSKDIFVIKYDETGNEVWRRIYDNVAHGDDYPSKMALDLFENVWVCGISKLTPQNGDFLITRFTPDGIPDVDIHIDGANHLFDDATCITTDKFGNAYAAGYTTSSDSGIDILLVRVSADGRLTWKKKIGSLQMDVANSIIVDDSCNVYFSGVTNSTQRTSDIIVQKYDSTGKLKWKQSYDGIFNERDVSNLIAQDDSMNVYVSGFVNHTSDHSDIPVLKYSRNGKLLKESISNGMSSDCYAVSLRATNDKIYLTANKEDYGTATLMSVILIYNKAVKEKLYIKSSPDVRFLNTFSIGNSDFVIGSVVSHPESTLLPMVARIDTLPKLKWSFQDSTVYGLSHIVQAVAVGNNIYFLGDDAGNATGTVKIFKYRIELPMEEKKKPILNKSINKSGVPKNK